jgi:hypothetical protein
MPAISFGGHFVFAAGLLIHKNKFSPVKNQ